MLKDFDIHHSFSFGYDGYMDIKYDNVNHELEIIWTNNISLTSLTRHWKIKTFLVFSICLSDFELYIILNPKILFYNGEFLLISKLPLISSTIKIQIRFLMKSRKETHSHHSVCAGCYVGWACSTFIFCFLTDS